MTYQVAERFKSIQGEGIYAGTPMAFVRFVGCSVGKRICQFCDTDFERVGSDWRGGGSFTLEELLAWAEPYEHICLTGGEPLDRDLRPFGGQGRRVHIETSGTIPFLGRVPVSAWICVSPKPGFLEEVVLQADEVKVIVPGLGTPESLLQIKSVTQGHPDTFRWPTLGDALRWAASGKTVFLQPRNAKLAIDKMSLKYVLDVLKDYPQLRLSCQLHKMLGEQ